MPQEPPEPPIARQDLDDDALARADEPNRMSSAPDLAKTVVQQFAADEKDWKTRLGRLVGCIAGIVHDLLEWPVVVQWLLSPLQSLCRLRMASIVYSLSAASSSLLFSMDSKAIAMVTKTFKDSRNTISTGVGPEAGGDGIARIFEGSHYHRNGVRIH